MVMSFRPIGLTVFLRDFIRVFSLLIHRAA
jgi:hypothetical protein